MHERGKTVWFMRLAGELGKHQDDGTGDFGLVSVNLAGAWRAGHVVSTQTVARLIFDW